MGVQMMLADGQVGGPGPLLLEMSLPGSDFYAALAAFEHACLYANCNKDNTGTRLCHRELVDPPTLTPDSKVAQSHHVPCPSVLVSELHHRVAE